MTRTRLSIAGLLFRFAGLYVALLVVSRGVIGLLAPALIQLTDVGALLGAVYGACVWFARRHGHPLKLGPQGLAILGLTAVDLLIHGLLTLAWSAGTGWRVVPSSLLPGLALLAGLHGVAIYFMVRWTCTRLARQAEEAGEAASDPDQSQDTPTRTRRAAPSLAGRPPKAAGPELQRSAPQAHARSWAGAVLGGKLPQLAATYRAMPTPELQRRIAAGGLVPVALEAAKAELHARTRAAAAAPDPATASTQADREAKERQGAILVALVVLAIVVVCWFLVPLDILPFILAMTAPVILMPLGKAFPRAGLAAGILFVAAPPALLAWQWHAGKLFASRGDYANLGHLVEAGFYLVCFVFCWAVGGTLIQGARHRGSWRDLHHDVDVQFERAKEGLYDYMRKHR
jgi:hypothetical protein